MIEFGNQSHSFNTENQLLTSAVAGDSTNFSYDALGRRMLEQDSGEPAHRILFSGVIPIAEYRQDTDALLRRFVFGDSMLLPIAQVAEPAAATSFMHRDQLGSVVALSNGSNASLQGELAYLPFGQVSPGAGDATTTFGFAGMYHHARSGLKLTLYRAYDSGLGRWLSRDALGESMGANLYAYVGNSPVNFIDPLGLYFSFGSDAAYNSQVIRALNAIRAAGGPLRDLVDQLAASSTEVRFRKSVCPGDTVLGETAGDPDKNRINIRWNPEIATTLPTRGGIYLPPEELLVHELGHARQLDIYGLSGTKIPGQIHPVTGNPLPEQYSLNYENLLRNAYGLPGQRTYYYDPVQIFNVSSGRMVPMGPYW